jgi:RimJ/RimL family protein N-acetyltransferase
MVNILPIESDRLRLRAFTIDDLGSFLKYRNDPEISRYQGWLSKISEEKGRKFIQDQTGLDLGLAGQWVQIALEEKVTGKHIGDCALNQKDDNQAEYGVTISKEYQRKGYALEAVRILFEVAFTKLDMHRIIGIVDVDNFPSIKLQEALGMRREGHHMQSFYDVETKQWRDEYLYAILKSEWINRS